MPIGKRARARARAEDDEPKDAEDMPEAEYMPEGEEPEAAEDEDKDKDPESEEDEAEDEEPPPSSKKPEARVARRVNASHSLAEILGLDPLASLPAQKSAALSLRSLRDHAAKLTGQRTIEGIRGGLDALATDAGKASEYKTKLADLQRTAARKERWALAHKLVSLGYKRSSVFVDDVSEDGTRKAVALQPVYKEMRLDTLRGLVQTHEAKAGEHRRDPFEPDAKRAGEETRRLHGKLTGTDEAALIERAKSDPTVIKLFNQNGGRIPIETIAAEHINTQRMLMGGAR